MSNTLPGLTSFIWDYNEGCYKGSDGERYDRNFRKIKQEPLMEESTVEEAEALLEQDAPFPEFDVVTNPAHYTKDRLIEPIDVIEDWQLDFHRASALKYIARAGRKGSFTVDIEKAIWYLQRLVK